MESSLIWVDWARNQCKISYRFGMSAAECGRQRERRAWTLYCRSSAYCIVLFIISIWIVSTYVFNKDSIKMKVSSNGISIIRFTSFTLFNMRSFSPFSFSLSLNAHTEYEMELANENLMQNCFFTYSLHLSSSNSYHFFRHFFPRDVYACAPFSLVENADSKCNRYT